MCPVSMGLVGSYITPCKLIQTRDVSIRAAVEGPNSKLWASAASSIDREKDWKDD